jgi:hypothetical protein
MKNETEIKSYYQNCLLPLLKEFGKKRKPLAFIPFINGIAIAIIFPLIYFLAVASKGHTAIFLSALPSIGLVWFLRNKRKKHLQNYIEEYKQNIIKKIVKMLEPSLKFNPKAHISEEEFNRSILFSEKAAKTEGEDLVYGKIGETQINFSELSCYYKTFQRGETGRKEEILNHLFKGIIFVADFNKNFKTKTLVLPDGLEKLIGQAARSLQSIVKSLVQLENPEFEKYFRVYAQDAIESRYLLSPAFMERISNFRKKTGLKFSFSFANSNIYNAIPLKKNMFEPPIYKSNYDYAIIRDTIDFMQIMISIVEELNLNTRIWSKQIL